MSTCRTARVMAALRGASAGALARDRDGDLAGDHRRVVRHVILVAEQQLQGVLAGAQGHARLGLAFTEVHDLVGRRSGAPGSAGASVSMSRWGFPVFWALAHAGATTMPYRPN